MDNAQPNSKTFEYFAFISYKREDEKWAKWLQKKLESYCLPTAIRKKNPSLPNKIRPIFRDKSELSAGNLKSEIENGLDNSKCIIVICSPRSAKSAWVSKEVQRFIDLGREKSIIPFIIGGTPNASNPEDECFPEGLRQLKGENEILGININEMGRDAAVIKIIARMFNLRFDSLWQRYEKEKRRRRVFYAFIAAGFIFASLAISGYIATQNTRLKSAYAEIIKERDKVRFERNRAERANADLMAANDSILKSKESLSAAYDSIAHINNDLKTLNHNLESERNRTLALNTRLSTAMADMYAENIEAALSIGSLPTAKSMASVAFGDDWLPITPSAERVLRKLDLYRLQDAMIKVNSEDSKFDYIITTEGDEVVGLSGNDVYRYDMSTGKYHKEYKLDFGIEPPKGFFMGQLNGDRYAYINNDSIFSINKENGRTISANVWPRPNYFQRISDSLLLAPSYGGFYEIINSNTFDVVKTTGIKCNSLWVEPYVIDTAEGTLYRKGSDNMVECFNIETSELMWSKKYDYDIANKIIKFDNYKAIAVVNQDEKALEIWPLQGDERILDRFELPAYGEFNLMAGADLSILFFSTLDYTKYFLTRWQHPMSELNQHTLRKTYIDTNLDKYYVEDGILYYSARNTNQWTGLFSTDKNDRLTIISLTPVGALAKMLIDGNDRYVFISKDKTGQFGYYTLLSGDRDAGRMPYKYDWLHGYEHYLYAQNKEIKTPVAIPFAENTQLTSVNPYTSTVAIALWNNTLIVTDLINNTFKERNLDSQIFSVNFVPNTDDLLVTTESGLFLFDRDLNDKLLLPTKRGAEPVLAKVSKGQKVMAVASLDGSLSMYSYPKLTGLKIRNHNGLVRDMAFSSDNMHLAVLYTDNTIDILRLSDFEPVLNHSLWFESNNISFDKTNENIIVNGSEKSIVIPFTKFTHK